MANRAGQLIIVYNGEIYNYRALRDALIADGVAFASESDTEVLLALYAKHGPTLNGSIFETLERFCLLSLVFGHN